MRDDAASIVAGLIRLYETKLQLLNRLLLSESDKLHYGRSGNLEKVIEIIGTDAGVIDDIDVIDFGISKAETSLSSLIGARQAMLYDLLRGSGDADELVSSRERALKAMKDLYGKRGELVELMGTVSEEIRKGIDDLSRICRLKLGDDMHNDSPPR